MNCQDDYGSFDWKVLWGSVKEEFRQNYTKAFLYCALFFYMGGCITGGCGGCVCGAKSCSSDDADFTRAKNDLKVCETKLSMTRANAANVDKSENNNTTSNTDTTNVDFDYNYLIRSYTNSPDKYYADRVRYENGFVFFQDKENSKKYALGGRLVIEEQERDKEAKKEDKEDEEY